MLTGRDCFGVCEEYNCTDCQDKAKEVYEWIEKDLLIEFVERWRFSFGDNWGIYNSAVNDSIEIILKSFLEEKEK